MGTWSHSVSPAVRAALIHYRACIRRTAWQEEHGTHGDGKLRIARKEERLAERALITAIEKG